MRRVLAAAPAWIGDLAAPPEDARPIFRCADLADPARFEAVFAPCFAPEDPRIARISFWSQYYFGSFCLPILGCALLTGRPVRAPLAACAVALNAENLPTACRVEADLWAEEGRGLLDGFFEEHLKPAVAAFAAAGPLAARVLWGNAAHYLEWLIGWTEAESLAAPGAAAEARAFLENPLAPDGGRNPLAGAIHYAGLAPSPETRRRKTCCLRHRLACVADCGTLCPKSPDERRRAA